MATPLLTGGTASGVLSNGGRTWAYRSGGSGTAANILADTAITGKKYVEFACSFANDSYLVGAYFARTPSGLTEADAIPYMSYGTAEGGAIVSKWSASYMANYGMAQEASGNLTPTPDGTIPVTRTVRMMIDADARTAQFALDGGAFTAAIPIPGAAAIYVGVSAVAGSTANSITLRLASEHAYSTPAEYADFMVGGSTAINATANVTIPGPSVSASARVRIAATLNRTIAGPTVASTGRVRIAATLNRTIAGPTVASTARVRISGAVAATIPGPTVVASATLSPPASGTVNVTISGPTLQAIGQLLIGGSFNGFIPGPTLQATGSLQPVASGTVNVTIPGPTLVANARVRIAATLNVVIAGPSLVATATVGRVASVSASIPGPSVQATATLSGDTPVSPQAIAFLIPARVNRLMIPERISVVAVPERKSTLLIPKR